MASRPSASAWLRGTVVRKAGVGSSQSTRSSTPVQPYASSSNASASNTGSGRVLQGLFGGGVKDTSGKVAEFSSMDDQCPVCKSDRYLNPRLRLLVSECYHKMCESCIDRLFTLGPAPCPVCGRTLRKLAFMHQTFEDLTVEKEVAVRRRLAKEFNKQREDFADLKSYNNYLQWVEDITFNLINDIDVEKSEQAIVAYRKENAAIIEANIQRDASAAAHLVAQEDADRKQREARARALQQEEEEERAAREADRMELLATLENSADGVDAAALLARTARRQREKEKRERERREAAKVAEANAMAPQRGARSRSNIPDEPHVPIQDDWYAYGDLYSLRKEGYVDFASDAVRRDRDGTIRAGGYMVEEAWERALRCAVAGLDLLPVDESRSNSAIPDVVMAGA